MFIVVLKLHNENKNQEPLVLVMFALHMLFRLWNAMIAMMWMIAGHAHGLMALEVVATTVLIMLLVVVGGGDDEQIDVAAVVVAHTFCMRLSGSCRLATTGGRVEISCILPFYPSRRIQITSSGSFCTSNPMNRRPQSCSRA